LRCLFGRWIVGLSLAARFDPSPLFNKVSAGKKVDGPSPLLSWLRYSSKGKSGSVSGIVGAVLCVRVGEAAMTLVFEGVDKDCELIGGC